MHVPTVEAHSSLLETVPTERVVTDTSPSELKLRFSEPIEQDLANVTIYDWNAQPVFTSHPDGNNGRSSLLEFALPELKQGTYTVKWSVVSLDSHPVSGTYVFAVGKTTPGGTKTVSVSNTSTWLLIAARTLVEGLLLIGAGFYWFSAFARKRDFPSFRQLAGVSRKIAAVFLFAGTIAEVAAYAGSLPNGLMHTITTGRWDLLLHFPFMIMLLVQLLFLILLIIPGMVQGWYLAVWFILAVIPAFGGHVWGLEHPYAALIPRIIHELSIALWLGALVYVILLMIWKKRQGTETTWMKFRSFFVKSLLFATGFVILSGIAMVFIQTGWTAVFTDWMNWSTLLICKIIFTICMLGLAVFQTVKWKREKAFSTPRLVRVEWFIGVAVIFLGVWMSQTAYPIPVKSYDQSLHVGQAQAAVKIANLQTGEQQMNMGLPVLAGEEPDNVKVTITMPDHGMKSGPYRAKASEPGHYQVKLPFSMSGSWHFVIHAEYPGGEIKEWEDDLFIVKSNR